jgi:hypothetical protein
MNSDHFSYHDGQPDRLFNGGSLNTRYEVFVGHTRVHVEGQSVRDAIWQARQRLCQEMPRLWDVIQALEADQFRVRPIY